MKTKHYVVFTVLLIFVAAAAFYCGMQYQRRQRAGFAGQFTQNGRGTFMMGRNFQGSRPVGGEIIRSDDKSVTVKLPDGSSKIIVLSEKTVINKASTGSKSDLKTGERITAFGTENSDGSVTAQQISVGGIFMMRGMQGYPRQ